MKKRVLVLEILENEIIVQLKNPDASLEENIVSIPKKFIKNTDFELYKAIYLRFNEKHFKCKEATSFIDSLSKNYYQLEKTKEKINCEIFKEEKRIKEEERKLHRAGKKPSESWKNSIRKYLFELEKKLEYIITLITENIFQTKKQIEVLRISLT